MLQTIQSDLLRCVSDPARGRCLSALKEDEDVLVCTECGDRYPVVRGIPVLKSELAEPTETWFEAMYRGPKPVRRSHKRLSET